MNFLDKFFKKENIGARILSVIAACCLWIYVMTDQNPIIERNYEVRLHQTNLPASMVVFNAPERVTVRVRAARGILSDDAENQITASINLKNTTEGQQNIPVKVVFTKGEVVSVTPGEVSVYVDTVSEKKVPVTTRVIGQVSEDLTVGSSVITPSEVTVKGATHRLDKISKVVAPIDITNHSDSFSAESELVAVSDDGYDIPNMTITPERVMVQAKMVRQMLTVELPVKVEMSGNLPEGIKVTQTTVTPDKVRITAPPSVLKDLHEIKTRPVDVSTLTGSQSVAAELDLTDKAIPETRSVQVLFSVER